MTRYITTTIRKVKSERFRNQLGRLSIHGAYMQDLLRRNPRNVPIVVAFHNKEMVGWAFLEKGLIGVYVNHFHRRMGIGKALVERVKAERARKEYYVSMHDAVSSEFFSKLSAHYDNNYRFPTWLVNGKLVSK